MTRRGRAIRLAAEVLRLPPGDPKTEAAVQRYEDEMGSWRRSPKGGETWVVSPRLETACAWAEATGVAEVHPDRRRSRPGRPVELGASERLTTRVPTELATKVRARAEDHERGVAGVVRDALEAWVEYE